MSLINNSKLGVLWNFQTWPPYRLAAGCVVKLRCKLVDGGVCEILEEQATPCGPLFVDDDPTLPPLMASNFTGIKPKVDVTFQGACHLAKPAAEASVILGLGDWRKELIVSGERQWEKKLFSWKMTPAKAFETLPLDLRLAYGGTALPQNPWGIGHENNRIPQIEYPKHRLTSKSSAIPPASFSPVHMSHPRRMEEFGTFDESWVENNWPLMPDDFKASAANEAPLDQQLLAVEGNEEIYLKNLIADCPELKTRLPGIKPRWFYAPQGAAASPSQVKELALMLDAVHIDGEESCVELVWRGMIELRNEEEGPSLEHYVVSELDKSLSLKQHTDDWQVLLNKDNELLERRQAVVNAALRDMYRVTVPIADGAAEWTKERVEAVLQESKDLSGVNLSGIDLSGCDLSDAILCATNFEGADLHDCKLHRAVLTHANLKKCDLSNVDLSEADLHCADFSGANLTGASLVGADASVAKFIAAEANGVQAHKSILFASTATDMKANKAQLDGADLIEASWDHAQLNGASLDHATATSCSMKNVQLQEANLSFFGGESSDLSESDLSGSDLQDSTWSGAKFAQSKLHFANCAAANFTGVDASGMQAQLIDARRAVFHRSNLSNVDFTSADLRAADAWGAELGGLNVTKASVHELCVHECQNVPQSLRRDSNG